MSWYRAICRGWLLYATSQVAYDSPSVSFGGIGAASLSPKGGKWQGIAYGWIQIARLCLKSKMEHQYFVVISNTNMMNAIFQTMKIKFQRETNLSIVCICLFYHVPYRSRFRAGIDHTPRRLLMRPRRDFFHMFHHVSSTTTPTIPKLCLSILKKTPRNGMSCNTYIILYVYNRLQ